MPPAAVNDGSSIFHIVSKLGWFLLVPSNALALVALAGVLVSAFARGPLRSLGLGMAGAAVAMLFVLGISPVPNLLMAPLENRFPTYQGGPPDGVVVLGGAVASGPSGRKESVSLNEAAERVFAAIAVAVRYPGAKLVYSGGSGAILGSAVAEARLAQRLFAEAGLDSRRLALETRSRNTAENAVFSRDVAGPRPGERWLLVTSAYHMPRAVGAFRAAGFPVEAYPVDFRTSWPVGLQGFLSVADGLQRADVALREWVGLLVYRLTRRTNAFFPAP